MKKVLLVSLLSALVASCSTPDVFNERGTKAGNGKTHHRKDQDLIPSSHNAAEHLMQQASYLKNDLKPIVITSIADITDLDSSSALGLMISEQIADRFVQYGFPVIDVRTRKKIKIRENNGEFLLSRDIRKISKSNSAGSVLLGTYAKGRNHVFISTRLVRPVDNRILSSYDFDLPLGADTKKLVNTRTK